MSCQSITAVMRSSSRMDGPWRSSCESIKHPVFLLRTGRRGISKSILPQLCDHVTGRAVKSWMRLSKITSRLIMGKYVSKCVDLRQPLESHPLERV